MSIKLRANPSFRARWGATQAPDTAALAASFVPAVAFTGQIAAFQRADTMTGRLQHVAPGWAVPDITLTVAAPTANLSSLFPTLAPGETFQSLTLNVNSAPLPTGVTIDNSIPGYRFDTTSPSVVVSGMILDLNTTTTVGSGNWATRIADPNVVWYHSFDTAAEVNNFRWTNAFGVDPTSSFTDSNLLSWQSSGGADGGAFMRITYPLGRAPNTTYWARPFMPLDAASTGRGVADPGANNSIPLQAWNANNPSALANIMSQATNPGWYGPAGKRNLNPTKFQGTDYWVQLRARRNNPPGPPPDNLPSYTNINGKFVWFTTTGSSFVGGEIVTWAQSVTNPDVVGTQSFMNAYTFTNGDFSDISHKAGNVTLINNFTNKVRYTGGWDTLMFHITPGEVGATGTNGTRYEAWIIPSTTPGAAFTKIWDVYFPPEYQGGADNFGGQYLGGWNALLLAIYHNGSTFTTNSFSYDYDQVIFSKAQILTPT